MPRILQDMVHTIMHHGNNGHYLATVSQTATLDAQPKTVWDKISNIVGLTEWVVDVKMTEFLSKTRRGIGAARKITFLDQSQVVEYVVGWKPQSYLSYIATSGLPLDAYHATLAILPKGKTTQLGWTSFLISDNSDKKQFGDFLVFLDEFYEKSLQNLKAMIEKAT